MSGVRLGDHKNTDAKRHRGSRWAYVHHAVSIGEFHKGYSDGGDTEHNRGRRRYTSISMPASPGGSTLANRVRARAGATSRGSYY